MDEPLGHTVGNALEVHEAIETLRGSGPADLTHLTLDLCERVSQSPRARLEALLKSGAAWEKFAALVEAQSGDCAALDRLDRIHRAPCIAPFPAPADGIVVRMDAGTIGRASVRLGAGRRKASDAIDHAVGFSGIRKVGDRVAAGEPLAFIHARTEPDLEMARRALTDAIALE
jgi:pyrimidine-nucleoside phosphorylase